MKHAKFYLALFFVGVISILFQGNLHIAEENDYFQLYNTSVFTSDEEASVQIYSNSNYSDLKIKLFKITDPMEYIKFKKEKMNRGRFDIWNDNFSSVLQVSEPIKEFVHSVNNKGGYGYWYDSKVNLGKNEPGLYLLQAKRGDQVAYSPVVISNYMMALRGYNNGVLAFTADANTGKFVKDIAYKFFIADTLFKELHAGKDGTVTLTQENLKFSNNLLVIAKVGDEMVFSDPYYFFNDDASNQLLGYVFTNQPVYRPGQKVHFKSVLRERNNNLLALISNEEATISIKTPKNKEIFNKQLKTNELGSVFGELLLDDEAEIGDYSIHVSHNGRTAYGSFSVQEYKKPEFKVSVEIGKSQYKLGDAISGKVNADYFFGSPVQNAAVVLKVYRKRYSIPWWYWSEYAWFYKDYYPWNNEAEFIDEIEGEIDETGTWEFTYQNSSYESEDYIYEFIAEVTDNSRRTITGKGSSFVTRSSYSISINTNKYFVRKDEGIQISIRTFDFSANGVSQNLKVAISNEDENHRKKTFFESKVQTNKEGLAVINFTPRENGYYNIEVNSMDQEDEVTQNHNFYVHSEHSGYWYGYGGGLNVLLDQKSYKKGDTLRAVIFNPNRGSDILIAAETNQLLHKEVFASADNFVEAEFVLDERFSPSFNIVVNVVGNKNLYVWSSTTAALDESKILNITVEQSKQNYKPGDSIHYFINITDWKNHPVKKGEFSAGLVDEAIYSIKEETTKPINHFFSAPSYFNVAASNSFQYNSFYSQSRTATLFDRNVSMKKPDMQNSSLKGILKSDDEVSWNNYRLLLISDNYFFATIPDETGIFNFENIASGNYQLMIADGYNIFDYLKTINIKAGKNNTDKVKVEFDNFNFRSNEDAAEQDMAGAGAEPRATLSKAEAAPAPENYVQPDVRQNFVDAAFWNPVFVTDEKGNAKISIKAPDNLTSWRLTLKALSGNNLFGQNTSSTIVRKELLVRIETPRFFRQGDKITISTIVHSYLPKTHKTKISFDLTNLELVSSQINQPGLSTILHSSSKKMYELEIESASEIRIDWEVKVKIPNGSAEIYCEALTSLESDAMKISVPILPKGIKNLESFTEELSDENESKEINFTIPAGVDLRTAILNLSLQPTLSASILQSLDELIEYPYGCVEQTMSRFLPAVIASSTFKQLNLKLSSKAISELPKVIDAGLKRLYSFQHGDGGWGWWKNDQTNPYMTAYVIFGLKQAMIAGHEIDQSVFAEGMDRLVSILESNKELDETTSAFLIYALSFAGEKEIAAKLKENISKLNLSKLNAYSLSLIGLSSINLKLAETESKVADKLLALKNESSQFVSWKLNNDNYRWQSDNVQATAMAIKFFVNSNPKSNLISKGVRWLIAQQRGASWNSTQQTAKVLFALIDYLKTSNELNPDYSVRIILNGKEVSEKEFSSETNYNGLKLRFAEKDARLKHGTNTLRVIKNGNGKLYLTGYNTFFADKNFTSDKDNFEIKKTIFKLAKAEKGDEIVYRKIENLRDIKSGDLIFVKLTVTNKNSFNQYVMIEDFFPAGFEIVKEDDYYKIDGENDYSYNYYDWRPVWRWHYADKEIRDEKISFFVTYPNSSMEFSYLMRAQIPGEFKIMPAEVSLMYYPEILSIGNMEEISVR